MSKKINWQLVIDHMINVRVFALKRRFPLESVETDGLDVLIKCSRSFIPGGDTKFSTYLYRALCNSYRPFKKPQEQKSLSYIMEYRLNQDDQGPESMGQNDPDTVEHGDTIEFLFDRLEKYEILLLKMHYYKGMTVDEIGSLLGVSRSNAHRQVQDAVQRCRDLLNGG